MVPAVSPLFLKSREWRVTRSLCRRFSCSNALESIHKDRSSGASVRPVSDPDLLNDSRLVVCNCRASSLRRCRKMLVSFLVFLFCLFLVLGAYLLATQGTDAKRARLRQRLSEALLHSAHTEDIEVVLARNELMSEIPWLNRSLVRVQAALHLKRLLDQADLHITPSRLVMFSGMAGLLAALATSVVSISILLIVVAGFAAASIPFVHVWWMRKKRFDSFLEHLPDALDLMSRALSAGHGF